MGDRPEIIVLTPVKNEAWILDRFLAAASRIADRIIVADQDSSDGSPEICVRYEKVKLIRNPASAFNEAERQLLLIRTARELCPGPKILLALDADEIPAADAMDGQDWQKMLHAPAGTVLYFEKPDLLPGVKNCIRYRDNFQPLGFVDDGATLHRPEIIHSVRIPLDKHSPRLALDGIKILHYGPVREKSQLAKNRYYSVLENIAGTNPSHLRRAFYGEAQRRWQLSKIKRSEAIPESWLEGWERHGIEMRTVREEAFYWQEAEVLRAFKQFGVRRFWLDDIWNFDWEACRQRALHLGVTGMPEKPVAAPFLIHRIAGKVLDVSRLIVIALKKMPSRMRRGGKPGWKRGMFEHATWICSLFAPRTSEPPETPRSIFVLRNNDIGDLIAITPLFEALKRRFPGAKIIAGVGSWNFEVLKNNPFVDEILPVNAPWHNKQTGPQGLLPALRYILFSTEVKALARHRCDIGIDVLGSAFGSLLMMRARIPFRLGVKGYAGGDSAVQRSVVYDEGTHVGRSALGFAELLGATVLPENRPQLFPGRLAAPSNTLVIAPGGGFAEKCWPRENYVELARTLQGIKIEVIGGRGDRATGAAMAQANPDVKDLTGRLSLQETFALIASSSLVVCNPSMAMHAAAAFRKPCIVLSGEFFPSASAHVAQWGYPETKVLGKETDKPTIGTVGEVVQMVDAHFPK